MKDLFYLITISLSLGFLIPIQAIMNAKLSDTLGHSLWGALGNFVIAALLLLSCIAYLKLSIPTYASFKVILFKPQLLLGGLVGAMYITSSLYFIPKIGALPLFSSIVCVQLIFSSIYDHFGWFNLNIHTFSKTRAMGLALLLFGLVLIFVDKVKFEKKSKIIGFASEKSNQFK